MALTDFLDMMPQQVTISPYSSKDDYNAHTYGTAVVYRARVVYKPIRVRTPDGADVVARGVVWLGPHVDTLEDDVPLTMTTRDKLVLPDSTVANILSIDNMPDEDGDHHTKIYFE